MPESLPKNSNKPLPFSAIDFEEIEWRSEYSYVPDMLAGSLFFHLCAKSVLQFGRPDWDFSIGLLLLCLLVVIPRWFKRKARLLLSGHSIILRRPRLPFGLKLPGLGWLLEDIEIPYAELGEIECREDLYLPKYTLKEIPKRKVVTVTIYSQDRRKRIQVDEKLKGFSAFVEELQRRKQKALERYQGYAKGTQLRQPERSFALQTAQQEAESTRLQEERLRLERLQQRLKA